MRRLLRTPSRHWDGYVEELQTVRETGVGWDREENELGVQCMAVAIRNHLEFQPVAAISVSIPLFRHKPEEDQQLMESMKNIAAGISYALGKC